MKAIPQLRTNSPFTQDATVYDVLSRLVSQMNELLGHGRAATMFFTEDSQTLNPGPGYEEFGAAFRNAIENLPLGTGSCGVAAAEQRLVVVSDTHRSTVWKPFAILGDAESIRSVWSLPIGFGSRIFGTLSVYHSKVHTPTRREVQIAQWMANHAVTALTELRLRENEQRYKSLFHENPNGVYTVDLQGRLTSMNAACEQITGYSVQLATGGDVLSLVVDDDKHKLIDCFKSARSGQGQSTEVVFLTRDGQRRHAQVTNLPVVVDGRIVGVHGIVRDVSEQKWAEQALGMSENRLRHAQRIAQLGYWDWSVVDKRLSWSDEAHRIFGVQPGGIGATFREFLRFVHPHDKDHLRKAARDAWNGAPYDVTFRIVRVDGLERFTQIQADVLHDEDGNPVRMIGTIQDITEKIRAERQIQSSEERYKSIVRYNQVGICALNMDYTFQEVNPAFERLVGYSYRELQSMTYPELLYGTDAEEALAFFSACFTRHEEEFIEQTIRHRDGHEVHVVVTTAPIVVSGDAVGVFAMFKDITQERQTEELLRRSEKLSVVGQMAAGVAHEIRNPLTALKGFMKLLDGITETNLRAKAYLEIMQNEVERIEFISGELLVLAKPQSVRFAEVNLCDILSQVIALLDTQAIMNNVELRMEGFTDTYVQCAENQMKQVFVNLIKNAIEAMPDGGQATVRIESAGHVVKVLVTDTGKGIPTSLLPKLGEPFYTTKEKGTGLGLMVTHKILENHKGEIEFASRVGKGTTATVTLPLSIPLSAY